MSVHWFWLLLTAACVLWYSSVTIYVAIKGFRDIKTMLNRIGAGRGTAREENKPGSVGK